VKLSKAKRRRISEAKREGQVRVLLVFDDGLCRSLTTTVDEVAELAESPVPVGLFTVTGDNEEMGKILVPLLGRGSREESLTRILAEAASELREELSPFLIDGAMSAVLFCFLHQHPDLCDEVERVTVLHGRAGIVLWWDRGRRLMLPEVAPDVPTQAEIEAGLARMGRRHLHS
jgi:hypothetical protein